MHLILMLHTQPSEALAPLFFAGSQWQYVDRHKTSCLLTRCLAFLDPAGAVFGKFFSRQGMNIVWWENKTVVGTFAVFLFAFISLGVPGILVIGGESSEQDDEWHCPCT